MSTVNQSVANMTTLLSNTQNLPNSNRNGATPEYLLVNELKREMRKMEQEF